MQLQANDTPPGGSSRSGCFTSITSTAIVDNKSYTDYGLIYKHNQSGPGGPIFLEFWSPGPKFSPDQNFRDSSSRSGCFTSITSTAIVDNKSYTDYGLIYKHNLSNKTIADIKREFADHLPYASSFKGEVATWKVHVAKTNDKLKGTDLLSTCNFADENKVYYPNTHAILYSYCLFLSVLARANDPFSALRHLKTWCRSSMTDERLDQLALGYINQERIFSTDSVLQAWNRSRHRKIALVLCDIV